MKPIKTLCRSKEKSIHKQVAQYLKLAYPKVIFRTDGGGLRLTIGQAVQFKSLQSDPAFPDLQILEPVNGYHGLLLELKRDREEIYKKDGSLKKKIVSVYKTLNGKKVKIAEYDHIAEQAKMIERLTHRGYKAKFSCGFEEAKRDIDDYFNHAF